MKLKFYRILFGIRGWFTSALNHFGTQADLKAEIDHHLSLSQERLLSEGMKKDNARKISLREFGNTERLKEECRDNWGMQTLSNIIRDARFAFRKMSKNKVTTLIAITILALSIGAATSVFSIVNTVLLNELPVPNPQELRMIYWKGSQTKIRSCSNDYVKQMGPTSISDGLSHPIFLALRERCRDYAEIFAFDLVKESTAQIGNHTFATKLLLVSDNFLSGLHAKPAIGRFFEASDVAQSTPNVVISHDVWAKYFHSRPDAIGSTIRLSGDLYTVIGVAPDGFEGVNPGQTISFYLPMTENSRFLHKPLSTDWHWGTRTMLRLKPGVKDKQVKQLLDTAFIPIIGDLAQEPEIVLATGHAGQSNDHRKYKKTLQVMLLVVGLTMLVASINLAGLSIAVGVSRNHEYAIRASLGASRWRLLNQSMCESMIKAIIGGLLGLLLSLWGKDALSYLLAGSDQGINYDISLDFEVVAFCLIITLFTTLISGVLPAIRASSVNPIDGLKDKSGNIAPRLRTGKLLVSAQIAVTFIIVYSALLYIGSFQRIDEIEPGISTENLLVFHINLAASGYNHRNSQQLFDRLQDKFTTLPGVTSSTYSQRALFTDFYSAAYFQLLPAAENENQPTRALRLLVNESFFKTMKIEIMSGRGFETTDHFEARKVVVVNETFTKNFLPESNPLNRSIRFGRDEWEIIGVSADTKYHDILEPTEPTVYFPIRQRRHGGIIAFSIRSTLPEKPLTRLIQKTVRETDPSIAIFDISTQEELIAANVARERLLALSSGWLGILTLAISCIGLYGLIAYNVARRKNEMAIRLALGAKTSQTIKLILRESATIAGTGILVALPLSLFAGYWIQNQLFMTESFDPLTIGTLALLFLMIALIAAHFPSRSITRLHPARVLRGE